MEHRIWRLDKREVNTGISQGSPLSPVLLNIYTLPFAILSQVACRLRTFTDDILTAAKDKDHDTANPGWNPWVLQHKRDKQQWREVV